MPKSDSISRSYRRKKKNSVHKIEQIKLLNIEENNQQISATRIEDSHMNLLHEMTLNEEKLKNV